MGFWEVAWLPGKHDLMAMLAIRLDLVSPSPITSGAGLETAPVFQASVLRAVNLQLEFIHFFFFFPNRDLYLLFFF